MHMHISQIDTPALLIDRTIMMRNLTEMQHLADRWHVALRPHTKTHKCPEIAQLQVEIGASGITVAKTSEAEVMAHAGLDDIFIANEVVGVHKLSRIQRLCAEGKRISFGVDSIEAIQQIAHIFSSEVPAHVLIEVETGEGRSGVTSTALFDSLLDSIRAKPNIVFEGIFSHEGHSYSAQSLEQAAVIFTDTQKQTLFYAERARMANMPCKRVSIGSTPSILSANVKDVPILEGIHEIRPGTYVFMDAGQAAILGSYDSCAATVLVSVTSKPTASRTIGDAGAKALTMQSRESGICYSPGKGVILEPVQTTVTSVYDEHTVIIDPAFSQAVSIGDTFRVIPNHICPVVNLFDTLYLIEGDHVVDRYAIAGRGMTT